MATFQYIAKDSSGAERRGTVEAADRSAAIAAVRGQGLLPTALGEVKSAAAAPKKEKASAAAAPKAGGKAKKGGLMNAEIKIKLPSFLQGRIKTKVLTQFTRQLATLVNAGLPLMRGIEVLKRQMKDPQMMEALNGIGENIAAGGTFSESLTAYPKIFDNLYVNMVKAGEAGGVFGIRRPGGSALNDTQVSSARAAERIAAVYTGEPTEVTADQLTLTKRYCLLLSAGGEGRGPALAKRLENGRLMDASGAFLRNPAAAEKALATLRCRIDGFFTENTADNAFTLLELVINYDSLVTSAAMLASILAYVRDGGLSRGSYVITDKSAEDLVRDASGVVCDTVHRGVIGRVSALSGSGISFGTAWVPVRPIPSEDNWFETVMRQFREGEIYR